MARKHISFVFCLIDQILTFCRLEVASKELLCTSIIVFLFASLRSSFSRVLCPWAGSKFQWHLSFRCWASFSLFYLSAIIQPNCVLSFSSPSPHSSLHDGTFSVGNALSVSGLCTSSVFLL